MQLVSTPFGEPDGTPASPGPDRPDVVAEVRAAFERYEQALLDGDRSVLTALSRPGAHPVRRRADPALPLGRRLSDVRVLALGDAAAVVTAPVDRAGRPARGRQTQTWFRFPDGWRIVSVHVSEVEPR